MQGDIEFKGHRYTYQYDEEMDALKLQTHDKKANLSLEFICKETEDTEQRWKEFGRMFAHSIAKSSYRA
jgi:hypothetical protein